MTGTVAGFRHHGWCGPRGSGWAACLLVATACSGLLAADANNVSRLTAEPVAGEPRARANIGSAQSGSRAPLGLAAAPNRGDVEILESVTAGAPVQMAQAPQAATPISSASPPPKLSASMLSPEAGSRSLRVVKDKSAILKTNRAISQASISSPEVADVAVLSPTEVVVTGKKFGTTQLLLATADGDQLLFDLLVEVNVQLLEEMVKSMAPTSRVRAQTLFDTIVLSGSVPDAITASRIADLAEMLSPGKVRNQMSVSGVQQVLIRCTVAEVNRTALRDLGMNWFAGGASWSRDFFLSNNLNQINPTFVQNNGLANLLFGQQTYTLLPFQNGNAVNLTFGFPRAELQFFVQALRQNGLVRVLAEPNVIALNGQKATFLVGGEVPIPLALQNTFSVEYKKFGIQLEFTPHLQPGQMIRMNVQPEVSDVDPTRQIVVAGFAIPGFRTRRFESTLEVGNGQTFAMAGLLNETVRATASKIPGIGDVPVLGTLFSSVQYTRDETELVILVTPELVGPLDPQQVGPVPGQNMPHPNDAELFLMGQIEKPPAPVPPIEDVPRSRPPVNAFTSGDRAWASSAMAMALRGTYGMSYNDDEP